MILISHRGNLEGPDSTKENEPSYIDKALRNYFVEVDFRVYENGFYLGHDTPEYSVSKSWLEERKDKLWVHCKNIDALNFCMENYFHCFWHDKDSYTLTSKGYIWAYPGKITMGKCITVMPEKVWDKEKYLLEKYYGVCSDFVKMINKK
jgi:hypothetical protein